MSSNYDEIHDFRRSPLFRYVWKYQATMNERPWGDHPSSKTRWLYLVAGRSYRRGSPCSVMSRRIVFRLSAPDADSSFNPAAFQECECHGFLRQPVTTVSDNEDDDLRPGDRLCTPANRYTFYALRLVCRFRFFLRRSIMWGCLSLKLFR